MRPFLPVVPLSLLLAACVGNPEMQSASSRVRPPGGGDPAPQQAALPPVKVDRPAALRGLDARQVSAVLGRPSFVRRDAPAEIWQYRVHACTLDLFLYESGGGQTVAHFAVRSSQPISEQACFDEVLAGLRGVPTS
jgi:hypothetical protein